MCAAAVVWRPLVARWPCGRQPSRASARPFVASATCPLNLPRTSLPSLLLCSAGRPHGRAAPASPHAARCGGGRGLCTGAPAALRLPVRPNGRGGGWSTALCCVLAITAPGLPAHRPAQCCDICCCRRQQLTAAGHMRVNGRVAPRDSAPTLSGSACKATRRPTKCDSLCGASLIAGRCCTCCSTRAQGWSHAGTTPATSLLRWVGAHTWQLFERRTRAVPPRKGRLQAVRSPIACKATCIASRPALPARRQLRRCACSRPAGAVQLSTHLH